MRILAVANSWLKEWVWESLVRSRDGGKWCVSRLECTLVENCWWALLVSRDQVEVGSAVVAVRSCEEPSPDAEGHNVWIRSVSGKRLFHVEAGRRAASESNNESASNFCEHWASRSAWRSNSIVEKYLGWPGRRAAERSKCLWPEAWTIIGVCLVVRTASFSLTTSPTRVLREKQFNCQFEWQKNFI